MKDKLFKELIRTTREGTKKQKEIAHFLINNKDLKIVKVKTFSEKFNTSVATISRFSSLLGYSYFKDFLKDWNVYDEKNISYEYEILNKTAGKKIAKMIKKSKNIFLICSNRSSVFSNYISKFYEYFLNIKIEVIQKHNKNKINDITINDSVILISLSGQSSLVMEALEKIQCKKVSFIMLTHHHWISDASKTDYLKEISKNKKVQNNLGIAHAYIHLSKVFYYVQENLFQ